MSQPETQAFRAASEIWKWRQTRDLITDRSIAALKEIIERHTATDKAHRLAQEVLRAGPEPAGTQWGNIHNMAKELCDILETDQTRKHRQWF